ncbi:MAG: CarD family transcriptional regulator [Candidatus Promineifilaceae bacterium]
MRIMTGAQLTLTPGDWIVHSFCGVGQVRATERKSIGGKENSYFRIEMLDSTVWYPVGRLENENIREVSEKSEFQQAINALKEEPEEMSANINTRKGHISQVLSENIPVSTACLVRDLRARHEHLGTLNQTESQAFRSLSDRLIQEWAVCMGISIEEANYRLQEMIRTDYVQAGGVVGPSQERRVKEQDRLLGVLNRRGGASEE